MYRWNANLTALLLLAMSASAAVAEEATIIFAAPTNTSPTKMMVKVGSVIVNPTIQPGISAANKRNVVKQALINKGFSVANAVGVSAGLTITGLPPKTQVTVDTKATGEGFFDLIMMPEPDVARITFPGPFDPQSYGGVSAGFGVGIKTNLGEVGVSVAASLIAPDVSGEQMCYELFTRLAPQADAVGAQCVYLGDSMEVYFDPSRVSNGGVEFGTDSMGPGCIARMIPRTIRNRATLVFGAGVNPVASALELIVNGTDYIVPLGEMPTPSEKVAAVDSLLEIPAYPSFTEPNGLDMRGLTPGSTIKLYTFDTAETDAILMPLAPSGTIQFMGTFDTVDATGGDPVFTAGVVTDVGQCIVSVSGSELLENKGGQICQALFQRLQPQAPVYGFQVVRDRDRLLITFSPAANQNTAGVVFGATTANNGPRGFLKVPQ